MNVNRKVRRTPVSHLGPINSGSMIDYLILTENEIVHKRLAGFRKTNASYDAAGATARVSHEQSGVMNRHHMITLTVDLPDGQQIVIVQHATGVSGLEAYAAATRFAGDVNRVGATAPRD